MMLGIERVFFVEINQTKKEGNKKMSLTNNKYNMCGNL